MESLVEFTTRAAKGVPTLVSWNKAEKPRANTTTV